MKKSLLTSAAVLLAVAAFAQTTTAPATKTPLTATEKAQMKTMREDIRAKDKAKAEAKYDVSKGEYAKAKTEIADARADHKDIVADRKELKSEGVKHPEYKAVKEVKKANEVKVKADIKSLEAAKATEVADKKSGNLTGAQSEAATVKADRIELKKDIREARRDGVKHPIRRAR